MSRLALSLSCARAPPSLITGEQSLKGMCRLAPAFRAVRKFLGSPLQCPFTLRQAQNYSQHLKLIQGDQAQLAPTVVLNGESLPVPGGEYNATPHLDVRYAQGTSVLV